MICDSCLDLVGRWQRPAMPGPPGTRQPRPARPAIWRSSSPTDDRAGPRAPVLTALVPLARQSGWNLAPLLVAARGRVALQDEVGALLRAQTTTNSLGAYFTFAPRPGPTDARRNCVSGVCPGGLPAADAAHKLFHLLSESLRRELCGVKLKDEMPAEYPLAQGASECLFGTIDLRTGRRVLLVSRRQRIGDFQRFFAAVTPWRGGLRGALAFT